MVSWSDWTQDGWREDTFDRDERRARDYDRELRDEQVYVDRVDRLRDFAPLPGRDQGSSETHVSPRGDSRLASRPESGDEQESEAA